MGWSGTEAVAESRSPDGLVGRGLFQLFSQSAYEVLIGKSKCSLGGAQPSRSLLDDYCRLRRTAIGQKRSLEAYECICNYLSRTRSTLLRQAGNG